MHMGSVARFAPPQGEPFDYEALCALVSRRIAFVPRYRQKVRWVPGRIANPVWVDDEEFDVAYHVRRSALPRPGTDAQLRDLVGRIMSRPLDRNRPLWEMYLVEGLADGRFAILTKTHHAMVDGAGALDIGQVILDISPEPQRHAGTHWAPRREPSDLDLVTSAVSEVLRSPGAWRSARPTALTIRSLMSSAHFCIAAESCLVSGMLTGWKREIFLETKAVFNASFSMGPGLPQILEQALVSVYEDRGWNLFTSRNELLGSNASFEEQTALMPCLADLIEQIDSRGDDSVNRIGNPDLGEPSCHRPAAVAPFERALLDQHLEHFLDEERIALRARQNLGPQIFRRVRLAQQ